MWPHGAVALYVDAEAFKAHFDATEIPQEYRGVPILTRRYDAGSVDDAAGGMARNLADAHRPAGVP
jgi:hypothetical protein